MIRATNLSPDTNLVESTSAVSRYNLSRSQKLVKVQNFNYVLMSVSGCNNHYKVVLRAGAKAKTVTNNLPILSVLCVRTYFYFLSTLIFDFISLNKVADDFLFLSRQWSRINVEVNVFWFSN